MEVKSLKWDIIFENISKFKILKDQKQILTNSNLLNSWKEFLQLLKNIELTIPTYSYFKTGVDDHSNWLMRAIRLFGRAYLEEWEIINSKKGKELGLKWVDERSLYFRPGVGESIPDLVDKNGIYYDVKHDSFNFDKAHNAKYIINYQNGGQILLSDRSNKIELFDICPAISDIEIKYNLPKHLFSMSQTELESYFYL